MRSSITFLRVLPAVVVLSSLLARALPGQIAPALRILREMEVTGAVFDRDAIAGRLAQDTETVAALRQIDDEDTLLIADHVAEMHHASGCPEASAVATFEDGILRVAVVAGPRYRCGKVRCIGNVALPDRSLVAGLTQPTSKPLHGEPRTMLGIVIPNRPIEPAPFPSGSYADTSARARAKLANTVVDAYAAAGRHHVRTSIAFEPDGESLALVVTIDDEGHESFVHGLELDGELDVEVAAAIASWAAPPSGTLATSAAIEALQRQVLRTARYATAAATLPEPVPERLAPLRIVVQPITEPPPFDLDRMADAAILDRAVDRVVAKLADGATLQLSLEVQEPLGPPQLMTLLPGRIDFSFGQAGVRLAMEHVCWGRDAQKPFSIEVNRAGLRIRSGNAETNVATQVEDLLAWRGFLTSRLDPNGHGELRWGVTATKRGEHTGPILDVLLHPSFGVWTLTKLDVQHDGQQDEQGDGDHLVLRDGDFHLRLAADGAVCNPPVKLTAANVQLAGTLTSTLDPGANPRPGPSGPPTSDAVLDILAALVCQEVAHETDRARIRAIARGFLGSLIEGDVLREGDQDADEAGPEFDDTPSNTTLSTMAAGLLARLCVGRKWSGRVVNVASFACSYLLRDFASANVTLEALAADDEVGPLYLAPLAVLLNANGDQRHGAGLARLAKHRWSFDAIWNDAADLLANIPSLAEVPVRAGAAFRNDPALANLFADLPDGPNADREAFRIAMRYVWSHGGESMLLRLLPE